MSSIQVKHVDPETHEQLRERAAEAGMTLGQYVLELIRSDLRKPSRAEWLSRVRALEPLGAARDDIVGSVDDGRASRTS